MVRAVGQRKHYWNGRWGRMTRMDILIFEDGGVWTVQAREGGAEGRSRWFDLPPCVGFRLPRSWPGVGRVAIWGDAVTAGPDACNDGVLLPGMARQRQKGAGGDAQ
jgi:hypothetical protein